MISYLLLLMFSVEARGTIYPELSSFIDKNLSKVGDTLEASTKLTPLQTFRQFQIRIRADFGINLNLPVNAMLIPELDLGWERVDEPSNDSSLFK